MIHSHTGVSSESFFVVVNQASGTLFYDLYSFLKKEKFILQVSRGVNLIKVT